MQFPEWTSELETELRRAYHNAPAEPGIGGNHHTGLKAVYGLLRTKAQELENERLKQERREEAVRAYDASMTKGPWDHTSCWLEGALDVGVPPDPFA